MLPCGQSLLTLAFLWKKLSWNQFYKDLTRKTTFSEGWSWFKFTNLGLEPGMALKLYTSVAKGLKLKISKFYVYRSYRGKTGREVFFPSLLSFWIRLIGQKYEKIKKEFIKIFKSSRQSLSEKFLVFSSEIIFKDIQALIRQVAPMLMS